jgi:hypothetical protein
VILKHLSNVEGNEQIDKEIYFEQFFNKQTKNSLWHIYITKGKEKIITVS